MQAVHLEADHCRELSELPQALPAGGFLWLSCERDELAAQQERLQEALQRWTGSRLVWLHMSDLLNAQLPSTYDATSGYDLLVFRRLAASPALPEPGNGAATRTAPNGSARDHADLDPITPDALDTRSVGFAVFDRVLLTVHPPACAVRERYLKRLADLAGAADGRGGSRLPTSSAELMLRMLNHMVDSYLDLRRLLTRQLGLLQHMLLDPKNRFSNWQVLLDSRNALSLLEDTCEDQRSAVQEWMDSLDEWPASADAAERHERELLRVRSRDVIEHIDRVLSHVRRLEHSAETAVQMHFSALGHRTNDIMRALTVLTAIFLPLNLITGFFGMNFDALPWIHSSLGFWAAFALMVATGVGLVTFFRRKRYLG
jgi:Mg2+ and Co2+ transporter CorA